MPQSFHAGLEAWRSGEARSFHGISVVFSVYRDFVAGGAAAASTATSVTAMEARIRRAWDIVGRERIPIGVWTVPGAFPAAHCRAVEVVSPAVVAATEAALVAVIIPRTCRRRDSKHSASKDYQPNISNENRRKKTH
jgi:hypothetical protein